MKNRIKNEERRRLEAQGYKFVTPAEFLGRTPEDAEWIEMRLRAALARDSTSRRIAQALAGGGLNPAH